MNTFITTKEDLDEAVSKAVKENLVKELPSIIRKASQKTWLSTDEVMKFTGWSRRTVQYLRDNRKIPFSQEGRRILYKTQDVEAYLESIGIEAGIQ